MGSRVSPADLGLSEPSNGGREGNLGELLVGRLAELDIDSVAAVRELREDG